MAERWEVIMQGGPKGPDLRNLRRVPWLWLILGLLVVLILWTSFYTVEAGQVALILRFGKFVREEGPGLHFKLPLGMETAIHVPVERSLKEEFGFRTVAIGQRTEYAPPKNPEEPVMLTGDLSIVDIEWIVQYRIIDPYQYLFHMHNPIKTLRDISQAAMRQVVGDHTVDEVLTFGREQVAFQVKTLMQQILESYNSGIKVENIELENVQPPDPVKPAFHEVNQAKQQQEQLINEAWEAYNRAIPQAEGEAKQMLAEAEGYAIEVVNNARGDARRFLSMLEEYRKAPDVTRYRIFLETMMDILPQVDNIYVIDENTRQLMPLLNFGPSGPRPATKQGGEP